MINLQRRETRVDTTVQLVIDCSTYDLWDIDEILSKVKSSIPKKVFESYPESEDDSGTIERNVFADRLYIEFNLEDVGVRFGLSQGLREYARHLEKMKDPVFSRYYSEACAALKERQEAEVVSD